MVLRIAKTYFGEKVSITFPTEASKVWSEMSGLEEFGTCGTIKYIIGEGISGHFAGPITLADLSSESGIQKINQLAELVDAMDDTTQKVFLGVLAAELPASLDGILHAASKVSQYELIAEVSTDRELGEWLVNHGHLGTEIPDTVRPYLDYPFIGAQYYKSHEGAYTPNGYVRLREPFPALETAGPHTIHLTLTAQSGKFPLDLPVTEAQLDQVKEALGIEDFAQVGVGAVSFSSQHLSGLIPLDAVTVEEANELAGWLQELGREDAGLEAFCEEHDLAFPACPKMDELLEDVLLEECFRRWYDVVQDEPSLSGGAGFAAFCREMSYELLADHDFMADYYASLGQDPSPSQTDEPSF